jgi:ABC-type transport system involved in cytochrome bd biosynthesis fused ATPase/permease subunit
VVGDDGVRLSGGERQKLALARALLGRPALLMLDEPTTYLDEAGVERLLAPLLGDPDRPAILLVSHDHAVAAAADRLYVVSEGRVREARPAALPG